MILAIRTDNPEAHIALVDGSTVKSETRWQAHRELSDTLLLELEALLKAEQLDWPDVSGVNVFRGPGSFTGLRIGMTVANTLSESLGVPIVGSGGDDWIDQGCARLAASENDKLVMPEYGAEANITKPRK